MKKSSAKSSRAPAPRSSAKASPFLFIRIELGAKQRIGPGKIELLESIESCGSISGAGRALGMSYKRAWDLVDEINTICGRTAVERQVGGKHGGGAILTDFGTSLIARYRKIEQLAETAARKELAALQSDLIRPGCGPKS